MLWDPFESNSNSGLPYSDTVISANKALAVSDFNKIHQVNSSAGAITIDLPVDSTIPINSIITIEVIQTIFNNAITVEVLDDSFSMNCNDPGMYTFQVVDASNYGSTPGNKALKHINSQKYPIPTVSYSVAPPGSPVLFHAYLVGASATGDWAGNDGKTAFWIGSWTYYYSFAGQIRSTEDGKLYVNDGSNWIEK